MLGWFRFDRWRVLLALGLLIAIAYARAPLRKYPDALFTSDGFGYYLYLPSLVLDHDLDFSNQVGRLPEEGRKPYYQVSERTGLHTNQFPIGCALLWLPFFVLAQGVAWAAAGLGLPVPDNGFGFVYELPVYIGSFLYGVAGLWVIDRILTRLFTAEIARVSVFVITFTTPAAYYLWFEPNMTHGVSLFVIAVYTYALLRVYLEGRRSAGAWLLLGALVGVIALVRPYNGLIGLTAIPVAFAVTTPQAPDRSRLRHGLSAFALLALAGAVSVVVFLPQVAVWKTLYGQYFVVPRGSGYERLKWLRPNIPGFLLSFYPFAPLLLPATVALVAWLPRPRRDGGPAAAPAGFLRAVVPLFLAVLLVISYIHSCQPERLEGEAFGQRGLVDWSVLFAIGVGLFLQRFPAILRWDWTEVILLGLAACNAALIALYVLKVIPEWGLGRLWPV